MAPAATLALLCCSAAAAAAIGGAAPAVEAVRAAPPQQQQQPQQQRRHLAEEPPAEYPSQPEATPVYVKPRVKPLVEDVPEPMWMRVRPDWLQIPDWVDTKLCFWVGWACPEPPKFIDSTWGRAYFFMLLFANAFVVLLLASVVGGLISHLTDAMPRVLRS